MSLWKALVNLTFEYYFKRKDNTRVQVFLLCNVLQGDRQVRDIPARPQVQNLRVDGVFTIGQKRSSATLSKA